MTRPQRTPGQPATVRIVRFARYVATSVAATAVDLILFMGILSVVFAGGRAGWMIVVSTVVARLVSALVNFALKRRTVFDDRSAPLGSLVRYVILAVAVTAMSALGTAALNAATGGRTLVAKVVVDGTLFFMNYLGHKHWVFARRGEPAL